MKIWILSDLHLEVVPLAELLTIPDADVCVIAGDLCRGVANGVHWLAKNIAHAMPCVYVAGNHEFYKNSIKEGVEDGRSAAQGYANIHFLEQDLVTIGGVCFIGATLWTDYRIEGHQQLAMMHARDRMNDYRAIALQKKPWRRFVPEAAARIHDQSRAFIASALAAVSLPTVVVTHHLPHRNSIPPRFTGDLLNAAYASDLEELVAAGRPHLWIHGHVHDSCDHRIHQTRVVANPRGYGGENRSHDPGLVIELDV
jgi:Icc-related predicted phosphoesterase